MDRLLVAAEQGVCVKMELCKFGLNELLDAGGRYAGYLQRATPFSVAIRRPFSTAVVGVGLNESLDPAYCFDLES